jgi:hypothetical protein
MQHRKARSSSIESTGTADTVQITLGFQRQPYPQLVSGGRTPLRTLRDILLSSKIAEPEPMPLAASAEPLLLLTEADFAPPEHMLPTVMRIATFAAAAIGLGAIAYFALTLLS